MWPALITPSASTTIGWRKLNWRIDSTTASTAASFCRGLFSQGADGVDRTKLDVEFGRLPAADSFRGNDPLKRARKVAVFEETAQTAGLNRGIHRLLCNAIAYWTRFAMYIERTLSGPLTTASRQFPVILIPGPRQVGKSTLLRHAAVAGVVQRRRACDVPVQPETVCDRERSSSTADCITAASFR